MNQSRNILTKLAGVLSTFFAVLILAFAVLMYLLETPAIQCFILGSTSLFPALIAVACLMPRKRTIAIRVIGAIVCFACIGTLIMSFAPEREGATRQRRGTLVVLAIAGGAMALKGRWPGSEKTEQTATEPKYASEAVDQPA